MTAVTLHPSWKQVKDGVSAQSAENMQSSGMSMGVGSAEAIIRKIIDSNTSFVRTAVT